MHPLRSHETVAHLVLHFPYGTKSLWIFGNPDGLIELHWATLGGDILRLRRYLSGWLPRYPRENLVRHLQPLCTTRIPQIMLWGYIWFNQPSNARILVLFYMLRNGNTSRQRYIQFPIKPTKLRLFFLPLSYAPIKPPVMRRYDQINPRGFLKSP